ncbi:MAG TPA: RNA methyltransferase [Saprospiraceae bacterium]|nr:RNA methyltransferase [Saprospiraceae bacterium]
MNQLQNIQLNRPDLEAYKRQAKMRIILLLDNIRSGLNVGAIFRTADAFAVEAIYTCGITVHPPHPEIMKTALGATESVNWTHFDTTIEAIQQIKAKQYSLIAIEQTDRSISLEQFNPDQRFAAALVFGNEMRGISPEVLQACDMAIEIPQQGIKHSLNVATSAGIVLWECYKRIYRR